MCEGVSNYILYDTQKQGQRNPQLWIMLPAPVINAKDLQIYIRSWHKCEHVPGVEGCEQLKLESCGEIGQ